MKKILLFALLLIPVPVFAIYMQPSLICANDQSSTSSCQPSTYVISDGYDWYRSNYEQYMNNGIVKLSFIYDMSNLNDDYVSFVMSYPASLENVVVTLDNAICDIKTGNVVSSEPITTNKQTVYGFVCPITKKSEVYLNVNVGKRLSTAYNVLISANNKTFKDKESAGIVAAIDAQTAQQNAQNQVINNTNTGNNASDFSNVVNNNTLPNNSHAFDILGGLQGLINGLQPSGSCSRLSVPIPFTQQTLVLPCMTTDVYSVHFPEIVVIWQLLVRGIAYYYILVNILRLVKETIDPFNFKLEVMDL